MNILAIDLATKTGWALWKGKYLESGVQDFSLRRGESPGMRYLRFRAWLESFREHKIDLYVYEQAHHRGGAATEIAAGLATRVQEEAAEIGADYTPYHSATLKKRFAGKGNAGKPEMIKAASHWCNIYANGVQIIDDNHADAIGLLTLAVEDFGGHHIAESRKMVPDQHRKIRELTDAFAPEGEEMEEF